MELIIMKQSDYLIKEAVNFIHTCYTELGISEEEQIKRVSDIKAEIHRTGTYHHTSMELTHGAKMAWRNNNRCIGRLLWDTLHIMDARHIHTAEDAYEKLVNHINFATNGGNIQSTITIFPPRFDGKDPMRIWNHQLLRYAGYESNGKVIGDSTSIAFTKVCKSLGWKGKQTNFDLLPLVIQELGQSPKLFEIPKGIVREVEITHPQLEVFKTLNLKWYAVPIISDMRLEIGGIDYPMAPFNGWYMGTEIGARNLADEDRYNVLPKIAAIMGLNTKSDRSLWLDKALVELNIAVLYSFEKAGVTIVDHHTAAKQFKAFERNEKKSNRPVTGNRAWLLPPLSSATTHIYHKPYKNDIVTPNYFYQKKAYNSNVKSQTTLGNGS